MTKNLLVLAVAIILLISLFLLPVVAQRNNTDAGERFQGRELWNELREGDVSCDDLSREDFRNLGEYFMERMTGQQHEFMDRMMVQMMGEESEEQMHVVIGGRYSGCDLNTNFSQGNAFFLPLTRMMGGGDGSMMGGWNWMGGIGLFGGFMMILFWLLPILGIVVLVRYLTGATPPAKGGEKTPIDILKERYAKGEINKQEFEEKKKDLS